MLSLKSSNLTHGQFVDTPPPMIAVNATVCFKVANNPDTIIGPEGTVTYSFTIENITGDITFYFNHPAAQPSSYYVVFSEPFNWSFFQICPTNPTGLQQRVTYKVILKSMPTPKDHWMQHMANNLRDTELSRVAIPGTHDSGTYGITALSGLSPDVPEVFRDILMYVPNATRLIAPWVKTQDLTIYEQLNEGIRYLDIRVCYNPEDDELYVCHGLFSIRVEELLNQVGLFIKEQNQEIVILDFNHFAAMGIDQHRRLADMIVTKFGNKLAPRSLGNNVTVGQIWSGNFNVLVFYRDNTEGEPRAQDPLVVEIDNLYPQFWTETSIEAPFLSTPNIVMLENFLNSLLPNTRDTFFVLEAYLEPDVTLILESCFEEPKDLLSLSLLSTPDVVSWITNDWENSNLNIVSVNFFNYTLFVDALLDINLMIPPPSPC